MLCSDDQLADQWSALKKMLQNLDRTIDPQPPFPSWISKCLHHPCPLPPTLDLGFMLLIFFLKEKQLGTSVSVQVNEKQNQFFLYLAFYTKHPMLLIGICQ